jgi:hypothetical protein
MNIFGHLVGLLGPGISPMQGLYLHRIIQNRKTRTYIHAPSRIRTHDTSVRVIEDSTCHWDCQVNRYFEAIYVIMNLKLRILIIM